MQIVVGVTGGIAAYKAAEIVRRLIKAGHEVQVVMTEGAKAFVMPMTFQALSGRPVRDALLDPQAEQGMGHIELARWADLILIAPASANCLARLAAGMADDLLTTVVLASRAPLYIAPAMNQVMWESPLTARNVRQLSEVRGNVTVLGPDQGEQACGDVGPGRLLEPDALVEQLLALNSPGAAARSADMDMRGLTVVITSGPTRERLDPVRYLSNDSSGKMGFALAAAAQTRGAKVILVAGPVHLPTPAGVSRMDIESAREMQEAVMSVISAADIFIGAAAVADFRPVLSQSQKIKKSGDQTLELKLEQNPDILAGVAALDNAPFTVGFAAETQNLETYARDKLTRKRLRMIIGNNVSRADIGFNSEYNEVLVITPSSTTPIDRQLKSELAGVLMDQIMREFNALSRSSG
ncbi:MAG: bifunctional phosphopantothenoylcysteine decarboxylase/phosphopantothenate--cysteine ligase CoaBC [Hahellaceae bacterium]|nr:bifunctional phosphopantothenoylcysteine decarboxylase/phosphopantothenate--cysteine ligase CoaBC [Hahellaceae bacterium]